MSAHSTYMERLRRLSISDRRFLGEVLSGPEPGSGDLDDRTCALVRLAALVALDGPPSAFESAVAAALAGGATADDIVDAMLAVGSTVGSSHLVAAAPKVALALGYDVSADLERLGPTPTAS